MAISGSMITKLKPKETRITAVVTRADGTTEDLGTIAYYNKNPLRQLAWNIGQLFKGKH